MVKDILLTNEEINNILKGNIVNRNKYLNIILNHLNQSEENEIIAIDGAWGAGKTVFLKEIEFLLKNPEIEEYTQIDKEILESNRNEYLTYYFNAWENDDSESALKSLMYKLVEDNELKEDGKILIGIKSIVDIILKFKTNGTIGLKEIYNKDFSKEDLLEDINKNKIIKKEFKNIIDELTIEKKKRILIIIDEIDRCKPTFAVDLLENIKHFYDDERIVFLVGTNNKELGNTICKVYGEKYDGYGYLDKFFDYTYELPYNYIDNYINNKYAGNTLDNYSTLVPKQLSKNYKLTMREYNRYKASLDKIRSYYERSSSYNVAFNYFLKYIFVPIALILKIKNKQKYYEFMDGHAFNVIKDFMEDNIYDSEIFDLICENDYPLSQEVSKIKKDFSNDKDAEKKQINDLKIKTYQKNYILINSEGNNKILLESINRVKDIIGMMQ